jgi:YesN/AraC family two-component response regulator
MTSILIADDQALVRGGLRMILEAQPDLAVVGEAGDGREALVQARELRPDLVLMDIRMPGLEGLEATPATRRPRCWCSPHSTSTSTSTRPFEPVRAAFC